MRQTPPLTFRLLRRLRFRRPTQRRQELPLRQRLIRLGREVDVGERPGGGLTRVRRPRATAAVSYAAPTATDRSPGIRETFAERELPAGNVARITCRPIDAVCANLKTDHVPFTRSFARAAALIVDGKKLDVNGVLAGRDLGSSRANPHARQFQHQVIDLPWTKTFQAKRGNHFFSDDLLRQLKLELAGPAVLERGRWYTLIKSVARIHLGRDRNQRVNRTIGIDRPNAKRREAEPNTRTL